MELGIGEKGSVRKGVESAFKSDLERGKSARRYRLNSPPTRVKLLVLEMRGLN